MTTDGLPLLAIIGFMMAGQPRAAIGLGMIALLALGARRWFLAGFDAALLAQAAGDVAGPRRLRRLHWGGKFCNAIQFVAMLLLIPKVVPT